jgi:hypothetical protein
LGNSKALSIFNPALFDSSLTGFSEDEVEEVGTAGWQLASAACPHVRGCVPVVHRLPNVPHLLFCLTNSSCSYLTDRFGFCFHSTFTMSSHSSLCDIMGFCVLSDGTRGAINQRMELSDETSTVYEQYNTSISCSRGSPLSAVIRLFSPLCAPVRSNNSVAFVIGTFFVRLNNENTPVVFIDAKELKVLPDIVFSTTYLCSISGFWQCLVDCVGTVAGNPLVVEGQKVVFPVQIVVFAHNQLRNSRLTYASLFFLS